MIVRRFKVNLVPGGRAEVVNLSQYDSDVVLEFELYTTEGVFTVAEGTTVLFRGSKPDGNGISIDAELESTVDAETGQTVHVVTVELNQQVTAVAGRSFYELSLRKDGEELNTANIIIDVERAPLDKDTLPSESVIRELVDVIDKADEIMAAAEAVTTAIDDTLTQQGKAADAKKVGDEISDIKANISEITEEYGIVDRKTYTPIEFTLKDYTETKNGITFTQNSATNTVTVVGTASATAMLDLRGASGTNVWIDLTAGKTYRLTGCPVGGSTEKIRLDLREKTSYQAVAIDVGEGAFFTPSENGTYYFAIRIGSGETVDLTFAPEIAEETIITVDSLTAIDLSARDGKVDKQQQVADAGKVLGIGNDGKVKPFRVSTTDSSKEVWVDNYDSIAEAFADGDIINFTAGKTYTINDAITVNKSCYIKGNGCTIYSAPREADPENPKQTLDGKDTLLYVFDIKHDNVVIENFNAYSEASVEWENGGSIFPNVITSNVYLIRVSANFVSVSGITTRQLSGAVRVADDSDNYEQFSYHDINISNITCLEGVINIHVGNVVRCTLSDLMLSNSVEMNAPEGHCIYISRAAKYVSLSNFTIYHNGGLFGGLSVHPSSSQSKALCSNIVISNGIIYTTVQDMYAIQVTWAQKIYFNSVVVDTATSTSVYISGEADNLSFNNCNFSGKSTVVRNNSGGYSGGEREIFYNNCIFKSECRENDFKILRDVEGSIFQSCAFIIRNNGTITAPTGVFIGLKYTNASKNFAVSFYDCNVRLFDDVVMDIFSQANTVENDLAFVKCIFSASLQRASLFSNSARIYGKLLIHDVIARNYSNLIDPNTLANNMSYISIDGPNEVDSSLMEYIVAANNTKSYKVRKSRPNLIILHKDGGAFAVIVISYASATVQYLTGNIDGVTVTKSANSYDFTVANTSNASVNISVL